LSANPKTVLLAKRETARLADRFGIDGYASKLKRHSRSYL
jgi:hypothetical protein